MILSNQQIRQITMAAVRAQKTTPMREQQIRQITTVVGLQPNKQFDCKPRITTDWSM
jgi:hypothetical protein